MASGKEKRTEPTPLGLGKAARLSVPIYSFLLLFLVSCILLYVANHVI